LTVLFTNPKTPSIFGEYWRRETEGMGRLNPLLRLNYMAVIAIFTAAQRLRPS